MSELLRKARQYQEENADKVPLDQRPAFHVSAPIGWINDPNGWSWFQGEYHLFFQYYPYDTHWGTMHWGHMRTRDFIRWDRMPVALAPDADYDKNGCYSGSAMEDNGKHILMYTGVYEEDNKRTCQVQCMAIGDGIHYTKMDVNPVITADMMPADFSKHDFRDPKLWRENERYYVAIGSKNKEDDGQVVIFESEDLKRWKYVSCLDRSEHRYGTMWECPDLFSLDGRDVLIISPQFMKAEGLEFHNGNNTMCMIGKRSIENQLSRESVQAIDYGLDFYAPQTLESPDGRRVMIAWMQSWDNYITPADFTWSGIMCIPRELSIKDGRLYQYPVKELKAYQRNSFKQDLVITAGQSYHNLMNGRQFDMQVRIKKADCGYFNIVLACNGERNTKITFEPANNILTFDRTYSGLYKDVLCIRKMQMDLSCNEVELRIIMDKYTIEIFVDGGKYAMSSLIFTELKADGIDFFTDGQVDVSIQKYDILL